MYVHDRYHHLIYDNVEEDYPTAHDIVREWVADLKSTLLIMDESAGYRSFLGADPFSAASLADLTGKTFRLTDPIQSPESLQSFRVHLRKESV